MLKIFVETQQHLEILQNNKQGSGIFKNIILHHLAGTFKKKSILISKKKIQVIQKFSFEISK